MTKPYAVPSQEGRIAIVTGASGGIGLWTALGLAKAGAHTVMLCRDARRGEEARRFVADRGRARAGADPCRFRGPRSSSRRRSGDRGAPPLHPHPRKQRRPVRPQAHAHEGRLRDDLRGQPSRAVPADGHAAAGTGTRGRGEPACAHRECRLRRREPRVHRSGRSHVRAPLQNARRLRPIEARQHPLHQGAGPPPAAQAHIGELPASRGGCDRNWKQRRDRRGSCGRRSSLS